MATILRLSEAATLAIHTMVLLAAGERMVSTREIALKLGASEAHLAKVLQRLARAGMVHSERGPKGGFELAEGGEDITLMDIYELMDGRYAPSDCLLGYPVCGGCDCVLGDLAGSINALVRDYLRGTKLKDLVTEHWRKHANSPASR